MAHKTLIGGTAYEIGGGKTLVDGTAYSIDKGKTLVGGTAYEVGFGPETAAVTLTLQNNASAMVSAGVLAISINGVAITSSSRHTLSIGDSISFTSTGPPIQVVINGESVLAGTDKVYTYVVKCNALINVDMSGAILLGITEFEDDTPVTITLSGTGDDYDCYIVHNGAKYYDAAQTPSFMANRGESIYCFVAESYNDCVVSLNGTKVAEGDYSDAEYYHTVTSNTTINFTSSVNMNKITITEQ